MRRHLAVALLPHLDALDVQTGFGAGAPGREPLILSLPEVACRRLSDINPWLGTLGVWEISILSAHGQVEDEVELLIKRRIHVAARAPRVLQQCAVGGIGRELPALPHALLGLERPVRDLLELEIEVGEEVVLGPDEAEGVVVVGEVAATDGLPTRCAPVGIVAGRGTPVDGTTAGIATSRWIADVVPSRLHDIDLTTARPLAILGVLWHHPDSGPQPIASRKFGNHLDLSVLDGFLSLGRETGGSHGREDRAERDVAGDHTLRGFVASADAIFGQIEVVAVEDLLIVEARCFAGERGHDMEAGGRDE